MSKYPDNIVFNYDKKQFDAFSKEYPTSSSSPNFNLELIDKNLPHDCQKYFKTQLEELQANYIKIQEEYHWTELIYKADYNFRPDIGSTYYLYERKGSNNFLSIIEPENWGAKHLGSFTLLSYGKWRKI